MSRRLPVLLIALAFVPAARGQYAYGPGAFRESSEPPLADDPKAAEIIRQAGTREPRTLAPSLRNVDVAAPAVVLTVQAPPTWPLNQDVEVRIAAENVSRVTARNVTVALPLPMGVTFVKAEPPAQAAQTGEQFWKIEKLDPGARKEFVVTIKPPANGAEMEVKPKVVVEHEQSAKTKFARTELKVSKTGPKQAQRFDILIFGVSVMNPGAIELTNVTVSDKLPPGLVHRPDEDKDRPYTAGPSRLTSALSDGGQTRTWRIERLAPRETRRFEYYVAATTAPAGPIEHQAYAAAAGGAEHTATDKVELIEPKLELKAEAPLKKSATLPASVRITLTNRGPRPLQNVVVTDSMDPCKVDHVGGSGQKLGNGVQWIVPMLAAGQTQVFDLVVAKPDGGRVGHKVTAVYRGLTQPAEAATEFEAVAALSWDFKASTPTAEVNAEVVYELTMRNAGAAKAENVRAAIQLPEELAPVKAEPEHKADGGTVTFEPTTLPPNQQATFRVRARAVKPSLGARVTAELSGDPFPTGPVKRQEMTAIGAASAAPPPPAPPTTPAPPVPVPPPPRP